MLTNKVVHVFYIQISHLHVFIAQQNLFSGRTLYNLFLYMLYIIRNVTFNQIYSILLQFTVIYYTLNTYFKNMLSKLKLIIGHCNNL